MMHRAEDVRTARPGEEPAQRALWHTVFGDDDAYLDLFYQNLYAPERMAVLCAAQPDGRAPSLLAMCALLPVRYLRPEHPPSRLAYLYALAVDPAAQGLGHGSRLLQWVDGYLKAQGFDGICTVPATAPLHHFFASAGYREGLSLAVLPLLRGDLPPPDADDRLAIARPADYAAQRAALLRTVPHIAYEASFLAHQAAVCRLAGGDLYHLSLGGLSCLAAAEYDGDVLIVKELLVPHGLERRAASLLARELPASRYELRLPPDAAVSSAADGQGALPLPFAMSKPFAAEGYLAFALD